MDLLWFFIVQFKIPIIGLSVLGLYILIRIYLIPVRAVIPSQDEEKNCSK